MTETWRPVVGFETLYEVSDQGRVRSLDHASVRQRRDQYSGKTLSYIRRHRGRMLRPGPSSSGHLSVALGRGNSRLVHALVLEAFVGPCPPGHECCHGDDVPANNLLGNLRWGTRSDNLHDAVRNGGRAVGERASNAKLTANDVHAIRSEPARWGVHSALAKRFSVDESTIRQVRDGRAWRNT